MKTVTIEVGGMLSTLSARGVEKQLARVLGVRKAEVNYVSGSATVSYDESVTDIKAIKAQVHECGYHCAGESLPKHVCVPEDPPTAAMALPSAPVHEHAAHVRRAEPVTHGAHTGEMAHEMGHGAGMDMQAMARDMRKRFLIAAAFTVPVFVWSPMGGMFTPPAPPFGLAINLWLFLLASRNSQRLRDRPNGGTGGVNMPPMGE